MESASCIEQKGVIENIDNGLAKVNVTSFSACAQCHSKNACGVVDGGSRIIEVPVSDKTLSKGDSVNVVMKRSLGYKAAFFAYIFPFMLVVLVLLVLTSLFNSELFSGLISLFILAPYFFGLYLFRERLKRTFTFALRKAE